MQYQRHPADGATPEMWSPMPISRVHDRQGCAISGVAYQLAPPNIIHSWVEVWYAGRWVNLEGFIIDQPYLKSVQSHFPAVEGAFCGFAIATKNLESPPIDWKGADTYIQNEGINSRLRRVRHAGRFLRQPWSQPERPQAAGVQAYRTEAHEHQYCTDSIRKVVERERWIGAHLTYIWPALKTKLGTTRLAKVMVTN